MTRDLRAEFEQDGYLVVPGFVPASECDALRARMAELLEAFEPGEVATIFSTTQRSHAQARYFLESGDQIRCFFEEEAFDDQGRLRQSKARSINKVGHALHDLDPVFARFSRQPELAQLTRALGVAEPLLLQSMYIFKQPRIGGEVVCHQDAAFLHTEPPSVLGLWFALADATIENGCLHAAPGGHKGPLRSRFVRRGERTETIVLDETPLPDQGLVPLELATGTLVVLHGLLPHGSAPNRSARSRHAYALHVIDGRARYSPDNWLRRAPEMPLRGFCGPCTRGRGPWQGGDCPPKLASHQPWERSCQRRSRRPRAPASSACTSAGITTVRRSTPFWMPA